MTSTNIYCVYLTIYRGNKLPPFYIGSSSIDRITHGGYHGTVVSKEYKAIWNAELKKNSHLFRTVIISEHSDRESALQKECKLQKCVGIPRNKLYVNRSIANTNGFFGMDVSGENNPMYGRTHTLEARSKIAESAKLQTPPMEGKRHTEQSKKAMSESKTGANNPMYGKRGENNPNYGKHVSLETKAKMSGIRKSYRWYTNGYEVTSCLPGHEPEGFVLGKTKFKL